MIEEIKGSAITAICDITDASAVEHLINDLHKTEMIDQVIN